MHFLYLCWAQLLNFLLLTYAAFTVYTNAERLKWMFIAAKAAAAIYAALLLYDAAERALKAWRKHDLYKSR